MTATSGSTHPNPLTNKDSLSFTEERCLICVGQPERIVLDALAENF